MIPFFLRYEYKSLEQYSPPLSKRRILMEVFNCANHLIECLETRGNITFILRSSPVISAPEMLMEKPSMSSSLEASLVSSTAASSVSEGFGVHSGAAVLGDQPTIPALVRSALGGVLLCRLRLRYTPNCWVWVQISMSCRRWLLLWLQ